METVIAIGNPGTGKSTILNCLAEEVLFKSGVGYGGGVTQELEIKQNRNGRFMDTPGFADSGLREVAAMAISEALQQKGGQKLLFFVTTQNGRVFAQDVATLKLVLDASPEIGNNYGIVINQVEPEWVEGITTDSAKMEEFKAYLFAAIQEDKHCSSFVFIPRKRELYMKQNTIVPLAELQNDKLKTFVTKEVGKINLTSDKVGKINTGNF